MLGLAEAPIGCAASETRNTRVPIHITMTRAPPSGIQIFQGRVPPIAANLCELVVLGTRGRGGSLVPSAIATVTVGRAAIPVRFGPSTGALRPALRALPTVSS